MLINVLVYKVYLYDNHITIILNTQERAFKNKVPSMEQIEGIFFENNNILSDSNINCFCSNLGNNAQPWMFLIENKKA